MNCSVSTPAADRESYGLALQMEVTARATRERIAEAAIANEMGLRPGRRVRLPSVPPQEWVILRVLPEFGVHRDVIRFGLAIAKESTLLELTPDQLHGVELLPDVRPFDQCFITPKEKPE